MLLLLPTELVHRVAAALPPASRVALGCTCKTLRDALLVGDYNRKVTFRDAPLPVQFLTGLCGREKFVEFVVSVPPPIIRGPELAQAVRAVLDNDLDTLKMLLTCVHDRRYGLVTAKAMRTAIYCDNHAAAELLIGRLLNYSYRMPAPRSTRMASLMLDHTFRNPERTIWAMRFDMPRFAAVLSARPWKRNVVYVLERAAAASYMPVLELVAERWPELVMEAAPIPAVAGATGVLDWAMRHEPPSVAFLPHDLLQHDTRPDFAPFIIECLGRPSRKYLLRVLGRADGPDEIVRVAEAVRRVCPSFLASRDAFAAATAPRADGRYFGLRELRRIVPLFDKGARTLRAGLCNLAYLKRLIRAGARVRPPVTRQPGVHGATARAIERVLRGLQ